MTNEKLQTAYWAGRLLGYDQAWEVAEEIIETIKEAQSELLNLHGVSGSLKKEMTTEEHIEVIGKHRKVVKMIYAINMLRDAECEDDILNAVAIKEELNWVEVEDDLKDRWNDHFGDAKKYLP